jgi:hypothetical protein
MKAFPITEETLHDGMDLRDYFAAKAMQAMLSSDDYHFDAIADMAYLVAENMMEAREYEL